MEVGHGRFTLYYRFETTFGPVVRMRVKVEINTREHFAVHGFRGAAFDIANPWFSGSAKVSTYSLSELLGTKLRALFQRLTGGGARMSSSVAHSWSFPGDATATVPSEQSTR